MTATCAARGLVDRHFEGSIDPRDERALRDHLPGCPRCRDRYERYLVLARLDPRVPSAQRRLGRGLGIAARRSPILGARSLALAAVAAIAAVWLIRPRHDAEFTARGGAAATTGEAVFVYRIAAAGSAAQPVLDGAIRATDELAFAYQNQHGWKRLLIYANDATGRRYWYHPAWTDEAAAPRAIAIAAGPDRHELPEAIAQPLPRGRIWLHAVFTDAAVDVRSVERGDLPAVSRDLAIALDVTGPVIP
jgi:hypothetical protein